MLVLGNGTCYYQLFEGAGFPANKLSARVIMCLKSVGSFVLIPRYFLMVALPARHLKSSSHSYCPLPTPGKFKGLVRREAETEVYLNSVRFFSIPCVMLHMNIVVVYLNGGENDTLWKLQHGLLNPTRVVLGELLNVNARECRQRNVSSIHSQEF